MPLHPRPSPALSSHGDLHRGGLAAAFDPEFGPASGTLEATERQWGERRLEAFLRPWVWRVRVGRGTPGVAPMPDRRRPRTWAAESTFGLEPCDVRPVTLPPFFPGMS